MRIAYLNTTQKSHIHKWFVSTEEHGIPSPNDWVEDQPNAADDSLMMKMITVPKNAPKIWIIYLQIKDETWQAIHGEM